jgi:hypothetical protein
MNGIDLINMGENGAVHREEDGTLHYQWLPCLHLLPKAIQQLQRDHAGQHLIVP